MAEKERVELAKLAYSQLASARLAQRARIVLLAADGVQNRGIAKQLNFGRAQVARWRGLCIQSRLAGIFERDLQRGVPPAKVDVVRLVEFTMRTKPEAATHWSTRKMAAKLGVTAASVSRHWRANGLKPDIVRGFNVSRNPKFVEKLEGIVGPHPKPFIWAKSARDLLQKVIRANNHLSSKQNATLH